MKVRKFTGNFLVITGEDTDRPHDALAAFVGFRCATSYAVRLNQQPRVRVWDAEREQVCFDNHNREDVRIARAIAEGTPQ